MIEDTPNHYPERRRTDSVPIPVTQVIDKLEKLDEKLTSHITNENNELANEIARVILKAFPYGDPDAHRLHHELAIQKAKSSAKFWQTMSTEIAKWGLIGFLGWAGFALWKTFLMGPK
ncbi:MAG: hypothetical protein JZU64_06865 [Rhodoferax sp.]|nr:hypothetical protein [Rhodoferax sp.]